MREALEALTRTYRTLESGLYYETRPSNPYAAGTAQLFEQRMRAWREESARTTGMNTVRDVDVLGVLVFLQRLEFQYNNGRRRGRAFIDVLRKSFYESVEAPAPSPIVLR
jgi:hypothetical protein